MQQQMIALQRENKLMKEHLQDAVMLAGKYKNNMGVIDQEELARLDAKANGKVFNVRDFDMADRNGEQ
ncbi:hypothetical protein DBR40_05385 [Pedobacter sp. KBW01]|uniref:hypothetical protein n=1 Tax=Pedobacter sp. KBW01 TaxID=2153364 RepID=UPI000F5AD55A|nr:hypothetical protein [Pedobacter sp. KBW01]RQO79154.1 hypothetical protein DBR40_05385 [Pedobacter sp. KBW01]